MTQAEAAQRMRVPGGEIDKLAHSSRHQGQPHSLQPGYAIAIAVATRKSIVIVTLPPLPVKRDAKRLNTRIGQYQVKR